MSKIEGTHGLIAGWIVCYQLFCALSHLFRNDDAGGGDIDDDIDDEDDDGSSSALQHAILGIPQKRCVTYYRSQALLKISHYAQHV